MLDKRQKDLIRTLVYDVLKGYTNNIYALESVSTHFLFSDHMTLNQHSRYKKLFNKLGKQGYISKYEIVSFKGFLC